MAGVAREWNSSPHLSISLWADTSPSVWCEAVVGEGLKGTAVHSKDSSHHGETVWDGGSTQVVSVQKRRPRPGVGPSTSWQTDVPWGRWAPWLWSWSWCWCAGRWGWPEAHTQPHAPELVPQGRDLENPPFLCLQSGNGNTHPKRLICIAKIHIYLKRDPFS